MGSRIGWREDPVVWSQLETSVIGSLGTTLQSWPAWGYGREQPSCEPLAAHTHNSLERGSEMPLVTRRADNLSLGHHYSHEIEASPRLEGAYMEVGGGWGGCTHREEESLWVSHLLPQPGLATFWAFLS